jgi:Fucosyltransferase, N-terminal
VLLCFFNSFFGEQIDLGPETATDAWEITHDPRRQPAADAVVFHLPTLARPLVLDKPAGQCWVAWSLESSVTVPELRDPAFLANFELIMTYERSAG